MRNVFATYLIRTSIFCKPLFLVGLLSSFLVPPALAATATLAVSDGSQSLDGNFTLNVSTSFGCSASGYKCHYNYQQRQGGDWQRITGHTVTRSSDSLSLSRNNGVYDYRVEVVREGPPSCSMCGPSVSGTYSNIKQLVVTKKPNPPRNLKTSADSGNIDANGMFSITWDHALTPPAKNGYRITQYFVKPGDPGPSSKSGTTTGSSISAQGLKGVANLPDGTYHHNVQTYVTVDGKKAYSDSRSAPTIKVRHKPAPVTGLQPIPDPLPEYLEDNKFTMKWGAVTHPAGGDFAELRYELQWKKPEDVGYSCLVCESHNSQSLSKEITLPQGSQGLYYFQARACNGPGTSRCGGWSTRAVNVNIPVPVPASLAWITEPKGHKYGEVDLAWELPGCEGASCLPSAASYTVERRCLAGVDDCSTAWHLAYSGNAMHYEDQVQLGDNYQYRIRACNSAGVCTSEWLKSGWVQVHKLEGITVPAVLSQDTAVPGNLPYSTDVTHTGDAAIRIPIEPAPGVNGLEPNISLRYSGIRYHQRNNEQLPEDILGYGWRLGGLSEIRRCAKNKPGIDEAIQLDETDNLCLDGEPLVNVSGTHWFPGAEYRTLRESFRQIELRKTNGKPWFLVKAANGNILEFGNTQDSSLRVGSSDYFAWSLNKITDAFGNSMTFRYHRDLSEGINYPLEIVYGNDEDARILFEYGTREAAPPQPLAENIDQEQLVSLYRILVELNGQNLREYKLISELADNGEDRRLKFVQLCGYGEVGGQAPEKCLRELILDWEEQSPGYYGIDFHTGIKTLTDALGATTTFSYTVLDEDRQNEDAGFMADSPFGSPEGKDIPDTIPLAPEDGKYRLVVTKVERSDGLGGTHSTKYSYQGGGLMSNFSWGFLGYHAQKIYDEASQIATYRQFRHDFPHLGKTARLIQCHISCETGEKLTEKRFSYAAREVLAGYHENDSYSRYTTLPYTGDMLETLLEGGQVLGYRQRRTTLTNTTTQNSAGEPITLIKSRSTTERIAKSVTVNDGQDYWGEVRWNNIPSDEVLRSSKTTVDFLHRPEQWLIGFPEKKTVHHYRGDTNSISNLDREQVTETVPWGNTNKAAGQERYPGDDQYELLVAYTYDDKGNLEREDISGVGVEARSTQVLESDSGEKFLDGRYPAKIRNPLGHEITISYDERSGKVSSVKDANGRETTIGYDPFGRETTRTNPDGVVFESQYEHCGCTSVQGVNPKYKVTSNSAITPQNTRYYDTLGRLLREDWQAFGGATIHRDYSYDTQGRLDYQSEPYANDAVHFTRVEKFDKRGRVRTLKKPDDARVTTSYSVDGSRVKVRVEEQVLDANGNLEETQVKENYYSVTGDLDETIDAADSADQVTTSYTYYGSGLLDTVTVTVTGDSGDFVSSFEYDLAGYRTQLTDPNLGTVKSTYNALGQLDDQTDNKGQRIDYSYDLLGRLLTQADPDGVAEWTYDPANGVGALGSRSYSQDDVTVFSESYIYNAKAQLESVDTALEAGGLSRSYQHGYSYYGDGRLQTVTYPNGAAATYDYGTDGRGYLHEIRDQDENPIKTFNQINARGQVEQEVYGNGLVTTRSYDPETGRLTAIDTGGGSIQNNEYDWRSNGTLESRLVRTAGGVIDKEETFTYDSLNRLLDTTVTAGGATRTLSSRYNKLGNITSKTSSHPGDTQVVGYQYDQTENAGPNAVSNVTIDGVAHTLHYDLNGAITRYDAASGDDKWITWNARQLPTEIILGNSKTTTTPTARDRFRYGPNGQRFYRETSWWDTTAEQLRTERAFILGNFEEQLPANDPDYQRIEKTTLDANVVHIAAYRHDGGSEEFREYLHRDHLGSVEKVTDETGLVILNTAFEPFGARRGADWQSEISEQELQDLLAAQGFTTRRGFTGHEHLDRTGLIHMNGRVYDPTLGRFLSPDPIVQAPAFSQSWNRYSYVFNNPLSLVDPSGYASCTYSDRDDCWGVDPCDDSYNTAACPYDPCENSDPGAGCDDSSGPLDDDLCFDLGICGGGGSSSGGDQSAADTEKAKERAGSVSAGSVLAGAVIALESGGGGLSLSGFFSNAISIGGRFISVVGGVLIPAEFNEGFVTGERVCHPSELGCSSAVRHLGVGASAGTLASDDSRRGIVVIGENQKRVTAFARSIGAEYFRIPASLFDPTLNPSPALYAATISYNIEWINRKMSLGYQIYDLGPIGPIPVSDFYMAELSAINARQYPYYVRVRNR